MSIVVKRLFLVSLKVLLVIKKLKLLNIVRYWKILVIIRKGIVEVVGWKGDVDINFMIIGENVFIYMLEINSSVEIIWKVIE